MRAALAIAMILATTLGSASAAAQPPMGGMPDPRQMSGIPRPDPQVPAGTVTVRCLLGGFAEPATDVEVELALTSAAGKTETRTARTGPEGRAEFAGLEPFLGGTAIASAKLGDAVQRSQTIALGPDVGVRVMLVRDAGASAPPAAAPRGGAGPAGAPHGGGTEGLPAPGVAFAVDGREPGTVIVGTFDLARLQQKVDPGVPDVEVVLEITAPGATAPRTVAGKTDASGRAVFEDLVAPAVPPGSKVVARARFPGGEQASQPFVLADKAMAMVFPAPQREQLAGPRLDPTLPTGTVRVRVLDAHDAPIGGQAVEIVRNDITGAKTRIDATTGPDGVARFDRVEVRPDALYFVGAAYDGAPWQSPFFPLSEGAGMAVDLRVYPVTDDPKVVRAAMRYFVVGLENDAAQVIQMFEVLVTGDRAYWPAGGLRIEGSAGAKSLVVHPRAEAWLEAKEKAPFAMLAGPIPPGQAADLSVAYVLDHDGALPIEFRPPFALEDAEVVLAGDARLEDTTVTKSEVRPEREGEMLHALGPRAAGKPLTFTVAGLPTRPRVHRDLGLALVVLALAGVAWGVAGGGARSRTRRLLQRRAKLLVRLDAAEPGSPDHARAIAALDRLYRECDARGVAIPASADA